MFIPDDRRYDKMIYNRCGKSGLKLSALSLGFWQNFSLKNNFENMERMVHTAFNSGITHFDLANNYGNPTTARQRKTSADTRPWHERVP